MFCGYTEIDIYYARLMVMTRVYVAMVRKFVNQDLIRILGNIFPQIESLTDGTVWTRTLFDAPSLNCFKNRLNKKPS